MSSAGSKQPYDEVAAASLRDQLRKKPTHFIQCRDMRHAWSVEVDYHVLNVEEVGEKHLYIGRTLKCMRCETLRVEEYVNRREGLEKLGQTYKYPSDYELVAVPRGVKPHWAIHSELFRRAMASHEQALRPNSE